VGSVHCTELWAELKYKRTPYLTSHQTKTPESSKAKTGTLDYVVDITKGTEVHQKVSHGVIDVVGLQTFIISYLGFTHSRHAVLSTSIH
jgi:hypothetical protein